MSIDPCHSFAGVPCRVSTPFLWFGWVVGPLPEPPTVLPSVAELEEDVGTSSAWNPTRGRHHLLQRSRLCGLLAHWIQEG